MVDGEGVDLRVFFFVYIIACIKTGKVRRTFEFKSYFDTFSKDKLVLRWFGLVEKIL